MRQLAKTRNSYDRGQSQIFLESNFVEVIGLPN